VQLCESVVAIEFSLCVPKMVFWGFCGWRCENTVLWPPKGTTLREFAYAGISCVKVGSTAWALGPWKDFANKQRNNFLSGNFGYMGRSNSWGDLDQMWHVGKCGRCNHVRNTWWLLVMGCGCSERGNLPSLEVLPLQHWSHYCVTVWFNEKWVFGVEGEKCENTAF